MVKLSTHYDCLKVTRDAPPEVIRAAYRSLSQKFHPDHNLGKHDSEEAMKAINTAYDILSDPARRRAHDAWIVSAELHAALAQPAYALHEEQAAGAAAWRAPQAQLMLERRHRWRWYALLAVALLAIVRYMLAGPAADARPEPSTLDLGHSNAALAPPHYRRPFSAPNGAPWPTFSAYVTGFQTLKTEGLSKITIDNGDGDSDVFVKLVALEVDGANPVRHLFIPAHGRFVLHNVTPGTYDVRYRDLESGSLARSEFFTLEEAGNDGEKEASDLKLSLPRIRDSRMQMYPLAEGEF